MATIQGVYVALFGRPADPTGLAYFNSVTKSGADLSAIGDLASTQEYKDRFAGQSNTQIVSSIYQSLFNRAPEAAGLSFFVDALNKGTLNIKNIAIAILDGAQGDDKIIATNKITAADNFTKAIDTPTEIGSYQGNAAAQQGRNFLTGVTKDVTTIPSASATDAAIAAIVATPGGTTPTTGVTIELTTAADSVSNNAANPAFKSTTANDTINATHLTLNAGDNIDAGLGTDTLKIVAGGALTVNTAANAPTLAGIENVVLTQGTAVGTLNLSKATGLVSVISDTSTKAATFTDIAKGVTIGVKGDQTELTTFTYKAADVSGTADAATLTIEKSTAAGITIGGIENLTVSVNGTSSVGTISDASTKSIVVNGNGDLSFVSDATGLKTLDGSALNGKLTANVSAATDGVTVTGSKFADVITLHAGDTTDKDVVVYNSSNISTQSIKDEITNFTAGEDKLDVKAFSLTGGKASVTTFSSAPVDGASFIGNAVAQFGADVYVDTNNNGKFDAATDLVVKVTATVSVADFIFS